MFVLGFVFENWLGENSLDVATWLEADVDFFLSAIGLADYQNAVQCDVSGPDYTPQMKGWKTGNISVLLDI